MHRFGGRWTGAKLSALGEYLVAFTTALKRQSFRLIYIDAFAGSGTYVAGGDQQVRRGSAQIALDTPGFDQYVFIEKGTRRCEALRKFIKAYPEASTWVFEGDANVHLQKRICESIDWNRSRAVLFLDPYGMQVDWHTLEAVAKTGAIDVWYLFPLSGVTRQLARNERNLDVDKQRSLDRVLGTESWREAFYSQGPTDLFGDAQVERHADSKAIAEWVTKRLGALFPTVEGPVLLRKSALGRPGSGPPLFALYFLVSNPSSKARELASKMARGVFKKLRRDGAIE